MAGASSPGRSGWRTFSAVVLFSVGFLRIFSGISYFRDSSQINDLTHGAAPWFSAGMITVALLVIYGLSSETDDEAWS